MNDYKSTGMNDKSSGAMGSLITGIAIGAVVGYAANHKPTRDKIKSVVEAAKNNSSDLGDKAKDMSEDLVNDAEDGMNEVKKKSKSFFKNNFDNS